MSNLKANTIVEFANVFEEAQKTAYDWLKEVGKLLEKDMNLKVSL